MKVKIVSVLLIVLTLALLTACKSKKHKGEIIVTNLETLGYDGVEKLKAQYKGKIIVINFFASWCPPCKIETPDFIAAYNIYKEGDFVIIGLSIDEKPEAAVDFVNEYGINYPVFIAEGALQRRYNIIKIPTTLVYDKEGKLAHIAEGMLNEAYFKQLNENTK